jgi:hypothetical protein
VSVASLSQLLQGGSFTPKAGGGFTFTMDLPKSKFKWDDKRLIRRVGEARAKALRSAGLVVKDRVRRGISSRKPLQPPKSRIDQSANAQTKWVGKPMKVGSRFGMDLIALITRVPKANVVTSWKTSRFPDGMLKQDIQSKYDTGTRTVVIGPEKFPKLNVMHERGGSAQRWFKPIARRARGNRVYGILTNTPPKEGEPGRRRRGQPPRRVMTGAYTFRIRVKARPYMATGLAKAMKRIPQEFRDQISGP